MSDYYTPGVCNINEKEVAYRKKAFYLGLGIGVPLLAVLVATKANPILGLAMFVPAWIGAIGYLQAKYMFCIGYAAGGIHSSSDEYGDTREVVEAASRKLDAKRARKINLQSLTVGAVVAVTSVLLLIVFS